MAAVEQLLTSWRPPAPPVAPLDPARYQKYATLQLAPVSLAGYAHLVAPGPVGTITAEVAP